MISRLGWTAVGIVGYLLILAVAIILIDPFGVVRLLGVR